MPELSIPNTFVDNTDALADDVNDNFTAIEDTFNDSIAKNLGDTGTAGRIVVCNASGVPQYTPVTGDIAISDTGAVTLASNIIGQAEIGSLPSVALFLNGQPFTTGIGGNFIFTNEDFDADTMHDNVTNPDRITFTTAGVYMVTAQVRWTANASGRRKAEIIESGGGSVIASSSDHSPSGGEASAHSLAAIFKFSAGQYVTLSGSQTSGGDLGAAARFAAAWMGEG